MRDFDRIEDGLLATGRWGRPAPYVAERAEHKCEYCGMDLMVSLQNYKQWSIDHIVPRSAGGTEDLDNLALTCWHCNGHLKGRWNPNPHNEELSRVELINRVKEYFDRIRLERERTFQEDCEIIGYVGGKLKDPHPTD